MGVNSNILKSVSLPFPLHDKSASQYIFLNKDVLEKNKDIAFIIDYGTVYKRTVYSLN